MFKKIATFAFLVGIVAILSTAIQASSTYQGTLGSNTGFQGATSISISSATATILPAVPSGCHEAWLYSDVKFNYGDATVSTNSYELNWASGTNIQPLVLDKFVTPNPTVYFRTNGAGSTGTVYVRYR